MKHASAAGLVQLAPLLARLRAIGVLKERKPGTFYLRSGAFLHFHEDPLGLFADVKLDGADFERFAVNTDHERASLLERILQSLNHGHRPDR